MKTAKLFCLMIIFVTYLQLTVPSQAPAAEYFTEHWSGGGVVEDIAYHRLTFTPNGSPAFYGLCVEPATELPVEPAGGEIFEYLVEWDWEEVTLRDGKRVWLYGQDYDRIFVGSSGFITFTQGDPDGWVGLYSHFRFARVAGVSGWLSPNENVSWKQLDDRVAITWDQVYEHWLAGGGPSTFQIELFFDGRIRITILGVGVYDPMVTGLSEGLGIPDDFVETDFTEYGCDPVPPLVYDSTVVTPLDTSALLELRSLDDGLPDPPAMVETVIVSLPGQGTLRDPGSGPIQTVPFALAGFGRHVEYTPPSGFGGVEEFQFRATDGGVPYDGGDSLNAATVTIHVSQPRAVYKFPLDFDPGWSTEGSWAFGAPLGQGSHNHDPTSGYTGDYVYGYNLAGNYEDNMPPTYLTSTAIDCSQLGDVELRYWRWLGIETTWFDHASVEVSKDGETWEQVWDLVSSTLSEDEWSLQTHDISAIADGEPTVYVRWVMGPTNAQNNLPGWNIDDIQIWALAPACYLTYEGDADQDCDADLVDFAGFQRCYARVPVSQPCLAFDLEHDGNVGAGDFLIWLQNMTGPIN